jgi:hypothetical protein
MVRIMEILKTIGLWFLYFIIGAGFMLSVVYTPLIYAGLLFIGLCTAVGWLFVSVIKDVMEKD